MEYHEIGERFEYDGVVLEVMERTHVEDCKKCYLKKECSNLNRGYSNHTQCYSLFRDSDDDVYYRLVEQSKTKDMEQENKTEATKNDRLDDKLRWELLPLEDVEDIVRVYTAGAKKYGPDKWQNLPDGIRRYKAALLRHLVEFDKGNEIDEETGCRHLAAVAWNAIAMLHISKQQKQ